MKNLILTTAALLVAFTTNGLTAEAQLKSNFKIQRNFDNNKMVSPVLLNRNPTINKPLTRKPDVRMVNPGLLNPVDKSMVNPGLVNPSFVNPGLIDPVAPKPLVHRRPTVLKPIHPKPTVIQPWTPRVQPEFHPEVYPEVRPKRSHCSLTRHTTRVHNVGLSRGIYVPSLGARMDIQTINLAQFGPIRVARIISMDLHSPLTAMGLQRGDCLTRVGNVRIDSSFDLENLPSGQMEVRFVENGGGHVQRSVVSIAHAGLTP